MSTPKQPKQQTHGIARAGPTPEPWAATLDRRLVALLDKHQVSVETLDSGTARFQAVPLSAEFSKRRSNLLLRRTGLGCGSSLFVDSDLEYRGTDRTVASALTGSSRRNWRQLRLPPLPGTINEALCSALRILGSPLASPAVQVLRPQPGKTPDREAEEPLPGRVLAATGELITAEMAAAAYRSSFRQPLARQLAVLTTRKAPPRAAALWGPSGAGRDHLLLAAAHPLLEAPQVTQVYRVSGAMLAAGCVLVQEVDAALMALLGEVDALEGCLLLVQDLDLCMTGSVVGHALVCSALDRGLRLLGTARSQAFVQQIRRDEALARRLVAVPVHAPKRSQTIEALEELARTSRIEVAPPALKTAVQIAEAYESPQPATAIGLLCAALAEAAFEGRTRIGPDDVVAVLNSDWPEPPSAARKDSQDDP